MTAQPAITFYRARVFHARLRPITRRFRYRVLSILVDIDRVQQKCEMPAAFSVGAFNLLGFDMRDHGRRDGSTLRPYVEELCAGAGVARPASIVLLCAPRILGYVFDPLSVYFCLDGDGCVSALIYEVRNTFGQSHCYVAPTPADAAGRIQPHECDKTFYVSPFMDMQARYRFLVEQPGETFALRIIERDSEGTLLTAIWRGERFHASTAKLLRCALDTPLAGFKVIAGIHWQALFLWLAGMRLRPRAPAPTAPGLAQLSNHRPAP